MKGRRQEHPYIFQPFLKVLKKHGFGHVGFVLTENIAVKVFALGCSSFSRNNVTMQKAGTFPVVVSFCFCKYPFVHNMSQQFLLDVLIFQFYGKKAVCIGTRKVRPRVS